MPIHEVQFYIKLTCSQEGGTEQHIDHLVVVVVVVDTEIRKK